QDSWEILVNHEDSGAAMAVGKSKTVRIPPGQARSFTCYGLRIKETVEAKGPFAAVSRLKFYTDPGTKVDFSSANGLPQASTQLEGRGPENAFSPGGVWCSKSKEPLPQSVWYVFPQPVTAVAYSIKARGVGIAVDTSV
ncbi:unnamed protein product, partial [Meganyctiphanes norvegica]